MPVDLMLLHRLGQPLPLVFLLAPSVQCIQVLGVVERECGRVAQLDLAIVVAHDDIVFREGGLGLGVEVAVVLMIVLVMRIIVKMQFLLGCGRDRGCSARHLALEEVAADVVPCCRRHPVARLGHPRGENPRGWAVSVGH